jgi:hypothetical protein
MANHGAAALLIASLLVAIVVLADGRVTVQVQRDIVGGTYISININSTQICMPKCTVRILVL